jgi:ComF family protein
MPFKDYINGFLTLLYPNVCKKCGNDLLGKETVLCRSCIAALPRTKFETRKNNPVAQSFWGRITLEYAFAIFYYRKGETLQKLIHQMKYKNRCDVALFLGKTAGNILNNTIFSSSFDAIVPVPLHPKRLRARGYNQCELLANGISEITNINTVTDAVIRNQYNVSQTKKGRFARWENVDGIFSVVSETPLAGKHILVIDDVITTGATLEACCSTLLKIPETRVSILTIGYSGV